TAAEHDNLRHEHRHQIRKAEAEIASLMCYGPLSPFIPLPGRFTKSFCIDSRVIARRVSIEPRSHSRTGRQRFPTSGQTTHTRRTGRIDQVMTDLGMSAADATINPAIENNAYTDAGSHRDIKQWGLVFACAPGGFSQSSGIGIVFNGRSHAKRPFQITDGILASPVRK